MRNFKFLFLAALLASVSMTFAACGMGQPNDTSKPPYEDETNNTNNTNNNGNNVGDDIQNGMDNIGDDIQNGIDNVEDGIQNGIDNIQDGMDNMQDGSQDNGGDMNNRGQRTSRFEEAGKNLIQSVREAGDAIRDGITKLSNMNR